MLSVVFIFFLLSFYDVEAGEAPLKMGPLIQVPPLSKEPGAKEYVRQEGPKWVRYVVIPGPRGPTGLPGEKGPPGSAGPAGEVGPGYGECSPEPLPYQPGGPLIPAYPPEDIDEVPSCSVAEKPPTC